MVELKEPRRVNLEREYNRIIQGASLSPQAQGAITKKVAEERRAFYDKITTKVSLLDEKEAKELAIFLLEAIDTIRNDLIKGDTVVEHEISDFYLNALNYIGEE
jgi:hypothetical protein